MCNTRDWNPLKVWRRDDPMVLDKGNITSNGRTKEMLFHYRSDPSKLYQYNRSAQTWFGGFLAKKLWIGRSPQPTEHLKLAGLSIIIERSYSQAMARAVSRGHSAEKWAKEQTWAREQSPNWKADAAGSFQYSMQCGPTALRIAILELWPEQTHEWSISSLGLYRDAMKLQMPDCNALTQTLVEPARKAREEIRNQDAPTMLQRALFDILTAEVPDAVLKWCPGLREDAMPPRHLRGTFPTTLAQVAEAVLETRDLLDEARVFFYVSEAASEKYLPILKVLGLEDHQIQVGPDTIMPLTYTQRAIELMPYSPELRF